MQAFASIVDENDQFRLAKGRHRLSEREQALLNAVYQVAEHELAELRVRYEKKAGQVRQERERRRFAGALLFAASPEGRRAALDFLTRPYIEYWRPRQLTSDATLEHRPEESAPDPAEKPADNSGDRLPEAGYRAVVDSFSGWPKAILLFVENSFARMSPLTTAIWFGILIAAGLAVGWAQRTYLIGTYDYYKSRAAQVATMEKQVREANASVDGQKTQITIASLQLRDALGKSNGLQKELEKKEAEWQQREQAMRSDNQKTQDLVAKNASEAVQAQLTALGAQVQGCQAQLGVLASAKNQLDQAERDKKDQSTQISGLVQQLGTANQATAEERTLAAKAREGQTYGNAVAAFSKSVIALVSEVFYEKRLRDADLWQRREEFRKKYRKLTDDNEDAIDAFSIPKTVE